MSGKKLPWGLNQIRISSQQLEDWPSTGVIKLDNVTVKYSEYSNSILAIMSLKIGCGEEIGVRWHSVKGKSSLVSLLFGLLELERGRILIDETDIRAMPPNSYRSKLNSPPQRPFFLPGTVRFNLALYGLHHISDQQSMEVMRRAGL